MDNQLDIIAVDHGWSNIKTPHTVFTTGIQELSTEPALFENVLEYRGKYYAVGGKRLEVKETKVTDDSFYLLTLAAIAKELKYMGKNTSNIYLSVGLPFTRFGAEKKDFIEYLSREREVTFKYEQKTYHVNIMKVSVFPQCYAAVADRLGEYGRKSVIVDIGSWTLDLTVIKDKAPELSMCATRPMGLITCMHEINKECVRQLNNEIDESDLEYIISTGKSDLGEEYNQIVESELKKFAQKVYNTLREFKINLDVTPITFVGGGASVMKLYGGREGKNISFVEDVKANAKGYEYLAKAYLLSKRKR